MIIKFISALLVILPSFLTAGGQPGSQSGQTSKRKTMNPQHWGPWPAQTRFWTKDETNNKFERKLNNELRFEWFLDRGEADLHWVVGLSFEDPKIPLAYEVRVRLTYNNGRTQDFPTRVATMDPVLASVLHPGDTSEVLSVIAILHVRGDVKLMQLFDHRGVLTWEAQPKPGMFATNRGNGGGETWRRLHSLSSLSDVLPG